MKRIGIIEYGGIGDCIATAVALSAFRGASVQWVLVTRTWDIASLWLYLKPTWTHLFRADLDEPGGQEGSDVLKHVDAIVRLTPFDPRGLGNFYTARVHQIAQATGLTPGPLDPQPFFPVTRPPSNFVMIHTAGSTEKKSLAHEEDQDLQKILHAQGAPVVRLPSKQWTMGETIEAIATAKAVVAVDSCMAHLAYWLNRKRLFVIHRDTDPQFLLPGMPDPPAWCVGYNRERIESFLKEIL